MTTYKVDKRKKILLVILLIVNVLTVYRVHAQNIIPATQLESMAIAGSPTVYLNSAMIDYSANCPTAVNCGISQLYAIAVSESTPTALPVGNLLVFDGVNNVQIPFSGYTADVIIGNNFAKPNTNYYMGVVAALPNNCGYDIVLYVYEFINVGLPGGLNLVSKNMYPVSNGKGTANLFPHIDIMPEYSVMNGPGGFPMCNNFIICYTDKNKYSMTSPSNCTPNVATLNSQFGINLIPYNFYGPLNGSANNNYPNINTTGPTALFAGGYAYHVNIGYQYTCAALANYAPNYADVSFAEVLNGSNYYAYITFTNTHNDLYVYGVKTSTIGFLPLPANFLNNQSNNQPRIEAIKNCNYNTLVNANYMVVDDYLNSHLVQAYSNLWTTPCLSGWAGTHPDYNPVITGNVTSSNAGAGMYNVGYYHDINGLGLNLTSDVDANTGLPTSSNYYAANKLPINPGNSHFTAISSTCNNDGIALPSTPAYLLSCWTNYPSHMVYYKIASSLSLWKQNNTEIQGINLGAQWEIGPNPSNDYIALYKPVAVVKPCSYKLYNLLGEALMENAISGNSEKIELSSLAKGMYILRIYEDGVIVKSEKIVKQ